MASYNKVLLMGNLTRDPELRFTANGKPVASFGLAINRRYKQGDEWKEEVCFVDITVWGLQAENCAKYLSKGRAAFIEGHLRFSSWETDSGEKRNKLEVVADNVQFLGGKGGGGGGRGGDGAESGEGEHHAQAKDDLPF